MSTHISVAIIGSFRQNYADVRKAWAAFTDMGMEVTSPKGTDILEEGISFVRFTSDHPIWEDSLVQTVALHRILRASLVYVVAPKGYVGRTTCYEIGRIVQCQRPLYFSEHPLDLPLRVPGDHVVDLQSLVEKLRHGHYVPTAIHLGDSEHHASLEMDLLSGNFRTDDEISI